MNATPFPDVSRSVSTPFATLRACALLAAVLALAGCTKDEPPAPAPKPLAPTASAPAPTPPPDNKPVVTVLVTGDEYGWLFPSGEGDKQKGGAAETLARWVKDEHHCAGPVGAKGEPACPEDPTIVISTGNHWGGPSISSYFHGEPMAEVMARMGYAASGFGNHELDFGHDQFVQNATKGGFPYVSANLKSTDPQSKDMQFVPYVLVQRRGAKIAIVALSRLSAAKTSMSGRFSGLELGLYEDALNHAVPDAWKAGADAVAVVADECGTDLVSAVTKHPEWKLAFVATGHCHEAMDQKVGSVPVMSPGQHFEHYLRAKLSFDTTKPAAERLLGVEATRVDVTGGPGEPEAAKLIAAWKAKLDAALGEEIGFTKAGIEQTSPKLGQWVASSWRETLGVDVAIVNQRGIRQGLPAGKITKASVYSVVPYENSLLTFKVTGADLVTDLSNEQAIYAGATKAGKGFKDTHGKAIDPKKTYTVATVEYLYFGGDDFQFAKQDPDPVETGMICQTPLIEWTRKAGSSEAKPLETLIH